MFNVELSDSYSYVDNDGNEGIRTLGEIVAYEDMKDVNCEDTGGLSTGEGDMLGKTLLPGKSQSKENSKDGNVYIIVNKNLSPLGRSETFSHEGYGHAYLYSLTKNRQMSSHQPQNGQETNKELKNQILKSRKETIKNF